MEIGIQCPSSQYSSSYEGPEIKVLIKSIHRTSRFIIIIIYRSKSTTTSIECN